MKMKQVEIISAFILFFFNQQEKTWRKCSVKTAMGGFSFFFLLITSITYFLFIIPIL